MVWVADLKLHTKMCFNAHATHGVQAASDRQSFNAEDFPSVSGAPGSSGVMSGGRWTGGGGPGGHINAEDFPALPGETCVTDMHSIHRTNHTCNAGGGVCVTDKHPIH